MSKNEKSKDVSEDGELLDVMSVTPPTQDDLEESKMKHLDPRHQRIIHMYLSGGMTAKQIAEVLGYRVESVRNILCRPHIKAIIEEIQKEEDDIIRAGIKAMRMKAMQKMYELMDSNQPAIQYQAARDILDRTGHKGTVKQEIDVKVSFEEQLKEVLQNTNTRLLDEQEYDIIEIETQKNE